jgi:hypothetical protein
MWDIQGKEGAAPAMKSGSGMPPSLYVMVVL